MKRHLIVLLTLTMLSACSETTAVNEGNDELAIDNNLEETYDKNTPIEGTDESKEVATTEKKGLSPILETKEFQIDNSTFEPFYFEIEYEDDDPFTWSFGSIDPLIRAEDGTLYFSNNPHGEDVEPGLTNEIFSLGETGELLLESEIYSPTIKNLSESNEYLYPDEIMTNTKLVRSYKETIDNGGKGHYLMTVEVCDLLGLTQGSKETITCNIVSEKVLQYDDSENYEDQDIGYLVNTSEGPFLIYQNITESVDNPIQAIPLLDKSADIINLHDPYNVMYEYDGKVVYIDFNNKFYFIETYDGLKRLDIQSGEPLYDGAEDKELDIESEGHFYPATNNSFYTLTENELIHISNDLEILERVTVFEDYDFDYIESDETSNYSDGEYYDYHEYEPDGFNKLGDDEFIMHGTYEYQRNSYMKYITKKYDF